MGLFLGMLFDPHICILLIQINVSSLFVVFKGVFMTADRLWLSHPSETVTGIFEQLINKTGEPYQNSQRQQSSDVPPRSKELLSSLISCSGRKSSLGCKKG